MQGDDDGKDPGLLCAAANNGAPGSSSAAVRDSWISIEAAQSCGYIGLGLEHVVKATVWIFDTSDFDAFNVIYRSYFGSALPARACVRAEPMGPYRVEIEVVAAASQDT